MKSQVLISGVDTLDVGVCVNEFKLSEVEVNALRRAKFEAQSAGDCRDKADNIVRLYGQDFEVLAGGSPRHELTLSKGTDLRLGICLDAKGGSSYPEVKVHFSSEYLWREGVSKAWADTLSWVSQWADVKENKVSRSDLCCDIESPLPRLRHDFQEVNCKALTRKQYMSIERHNSGIRESGYSFGAGNPMRCRIYDKTLEIERKSHKTWFHDLWIDAGWHEGPVTRVEFQMRRKALKDRGINTVEDLIDRQADLWQYLTSEWLLLSIPSASDVNKSRWAIKPFWKLTQAGGVLFGKFRACVRRVAQVIPKIEQLEKQALGVIASIGAAYRSIVQSNEDYSKPEFMLNRFTRWLKADSFEDKVQKRAIKYSALLPANV